MKEIIGQIVELKKDVEEIVENYRTAILKCIEVICKKAGKITTSNEVYMANGMSICDTYIHLNNGLEVDVYEIKVENGRVVYGTSEGEVWGETR